MKTQLNHMQLYEINSPLESVGRVERYISRQKSVGTPVILHRLEVPDPDAMSEEIFTHLGRWAMFNHPRLPLLCDAWQTPMGFEWVTIEPEGDWVDQTDARIRIERCGLQFNQELPYQTLSALSALHEAGVSHGRVRAQCYIAAGGGLIFMRYAGLLDRINQSMDSQSGVGSLKGFMLASNTMARDVADWAIAVGRVLTGDPLIDDIDLQNTNSTPGPISKAQEKLRSILPDKTLVRLLCEAMEARSREDGGFENATVALKAYSEQFPQELPT